MDIKNLKKIMPILQAIVDSKTIQHQTINREWYDTNVASLDHLVTYYKDYRIKPEPKYRPFKDAEECWQEMMKHQPFGVVKDKYFANYQTHRAFICLITGGCDFGGYEDETFESCFKDLLFADGTPFGVKVEE
jgi:hypothetical protein